MCIFKVIWIKKKYSHLATSQISEWEHSSECSVQFTFFYSLILRLDLHQKSSYRVSIKTLMF